MRADLPPQPMSFDDHCYSRDKFTTRCLSSKFPRPLSLPTNLLRHLFDMKGSPGSFFIPSLCRSTFHCFRVYSSIPLIAVLLPYLSSVHNVVTMRSFKCWTSGLLLAFRIGQGSTDIMESRYGPKGFSISSEPSIGLRMVICGPRRTARPIFLIWGSAASMFSFTSSSTRLRS